MNAVQIVVQPTDLVFTESPDAGDPQCVCSRCQRRIGEEEGAVIRASASESTELRYCNDCAAAPQGLLITFAFPPYVNGFPGHWRSEQSGALAGAVKSYFDHVMGKGPAPGDWQLQMLVAFLAWWVQAPCWNAANEHDSAPRFASFAARLCH
ncbi:MAG: hypothetical protein AB1705_25145 [Verrucomicrobiota bacterium]